MYDQNIIRPRTRARPEGKSPQRLLVDHCPGCDEAHTNRRVQRPRIPDDTWNLALEQAQTRRLPIGHVITELLEAWIDGEVDV